MSIVRKIQRTKILALDELNKTYQWLYQIMLFVVRKNQGLVKIRKQVNY